MDFLVAVLYEHHCVPTPIVGIYIKWFMESLLQSHYLHLDGKVIQRHGGTCPEVP